MSVLCSIECLVSTFCKCFTPAFIHAEMADSNTCDEHLLAIGTSLESHEHNQDHDRQASTFQEWLPKWGDMDLFRPNGLKWIILVQNGLVKS